MIYFLTALPVGQMRPNGNARRPQHPMGHLCCGGYWCQSKQGCTVGTADMISEGGILMAEREMLSAHAWHLRRHLQSATSRPPAPQCQCLSTQHPMGRAAEDAGTNPSKAARLRLQIIISNPTQIGHRSRLSSYCTLDPTVLTGRVFATPGLRQACCTALATTWCLVTMLKVSAALNTPAHSPPTRDPTQKGT